MKLFIYVLCYLLVALNLIAATPSFSDFSIERTEIVDVRKVNQGETLSFKINNVTKVEIYNKPENATFSNYTFTWTPDKSQSGLYNIGFKILDSTPNDFVYVNVIVVHTKLNISVNKKYSYLFTATDPDNDPIKIEASGLPAGSSFNGTEFGPKLFEWTPTEAQVGTHHIVITATDYPKTGTSKVDTKHIYINVVKLTNSEMKFDFNDDGKVDLKDYMEFSLNWLKGVDIVPNTNPTTIISENPDVNLEAVVYTTPSGTKYHLDGCRFLSDSKIKTTLLNALLQGFTPCSACNPPSITSAN